MDTSTRRPDASAVSSFRPLRRWAALTVGLLLALVALRAWWGWEVNRRIAREVAEARARGEPIRPEDFDPVPVPGNQNAVPIYERAMAAVRLTPAQRQALNDFDPDATLTPAVRAEFESALKANAEALRLAREARLRPLASWDGRILRPPDYGGDERDAAGPLVELLTAAGETAATADDFNAAGQIWHDLAHFARVLRQCNMNSYAARSDSITWWLGATIERHADDLTIGGARGAEPADVQAVIAELMDDADWRARAVRRWQVSRMVCLDSIAREPYDWPAGWRPVAAALRPLLEMDKLRVARRQGAIADALARAPDVPTIGTLLPTAPAGIADARSRLDRIAHYNSDDSNPDPAYYLARTYFREVGDRHLTATALAAWLYRADHGGAWPADVASLVPAYLPSAPTDPFAAGGRGVKVAAAGGWHAVYSVALNGKDEGGPLPWAFAVKSPLGWNKWNGADAVFYLERARPSSPAPSTTTSPAQAEDN